MPARRTSGKRRPSVFDKDYEYPQHKGPRGTPEMWAEMFQERMGIDQAETILGGKGKHADAYKILGIEPGVTWATVKSAYRKKAREVHPDCGGTKEAFQVLLAAYTVLAKLYGED